MTPSKKQNKTRRDKTHNKANKSWHRPWGNFLMGFFYFKENICIFIDSISSIELRTFLITKVVHAYI